MSDICLKPNCDRLPVHRGLCWSCYQSARRFVSLNQVTWKQLEEAGKCLPSKQRGKNSGASWFLEGVQPQPAEVQS